jgi:glutathione S-transferase
MHDGDRITAYPEGYSVKNDWKQIDKIRYHIDSELAKNKYCTADCLTALCILAIETVYNSQISKHQFLSKISQWWEEMDSQVHDR